MTKIHGAEYACSVIFSKTFDFVIPSYQRPYAWTTDEAIELFDDLLGAMEEQTITNGDNIDPYFLGNIVRIKEEDKPRSEVVDGQQRLTTLTILFSALVDVLSGDKSRAFEKCINEPGDIAEDREPKPRVVLRERDNVFFHQHVQSPGGISQLVDESAPRNSDVQLRIWENAREFLGRLREMDEDRAFRFAKFIVNHCYLVAVSTSNMNSAYRVFSVLNDRGLDLLPSDVLKADVIGKISEAKRNHYTQKWEDAEELLGRTAFGELFGHIRMIYQKAKAKKTILEEFREHVLAAEERPETLVDDVIYPLADAYRLAAFAQYESAADAETVNCTLRWLERIDNRDWVPPAILYVREHEGDTERLAKFFERLERMAAMMLVCRWTINQRIDRYARIIEAIESGSDLGTADSPMELADAEKEAFVDSLNDDVYGMLARVRNYVLLRLDSWLSDRAAVYDRKRLTVEHVLPQTVTKGSGWEEIWPDENSRVHWVHRLGNLVLLTRNKNSSAGNYDFTAKKTRYFQSKNGVTSFALTTQVLGESEWTEQVVKRRQDDLVQVLKDKWQLA